MEKEFPMIFMRYFKKKNSNSKIDYFFLFFFLTRKTFKNLTMNKSSVAASSSVITNSLSSVAKGSKFEKTVFEELKRMGINCKRVG